VQIGQRLMERRRHDRVLLLRIVRCCRGELSRFAPLLLLLLLLLEPRLPLLPDQPLLPVRFPISECKELTFRSKRTTRKAGSDLSSDPCTFSSGSRPDAGMPLYSLLSASSRSA
jgi:hypothetical protein